MTAISKGAGGLDGVVAAETALSHVDGARGELIIAGEHVATLAARYSFEAVTARLWSTAAATPLDPAVVTAQLEQARHAAFDLVPALLPLVRDMPVSGAFRAGVAALRPLAGLPAEAALVGGLPVLAAALARQAQGLEPVAPRAGLGHATDTLHMLSGEVPDEQQVQALNAYLVTVCDHGMNASTFTARVVASTEADLFMAVTAAYCALSGPLHGGAPEPVLTMLDEIGSSGRIAGWIDDALARGERLMGFGHRIYRVRDPRADVLRYAVGLLGGDAIDLGFAAEVEAYARKALQAAKPGRQIDTNVEFYTAILLDALRIPRDAFTAIFAAGRAAGWTAHALEQQRLGRLIRPQSTYIGAVPGAAAS